MKLTQSNIVIIKRLLVGRSNRPLRSILSKIDPADVAAILPELDEAKTRILMEALTQTERGAMTLLHLSEHQRLEILLRLGTTEVLQILRNTNDEETARIIGVMDPAKQSEFLESLPSDRRIKVQKFLNFPEESAGRFMQSNVFSLSSEMSAVDALTELRERAQNESIYYIFCVNPSGVLEGVVSIRQLVISAPQTKLSSLMRRELIVIKSDEKATEAAELVSKYSLIAIPVVDDSYHLLGIITVDDIVDLIQEKATAEVYAQAGLKEDDRVYTSTIKSVQKRLPWMLVNLSLAALASTVVSVYESTMSALIVLASLKNIVAGVAGNTAIQSLTVVTRGIAVDDFKFVSHFKALRKEFLAGIIIGLITGLSAAVLTYIWKKNAMVSVVILISMIVNSLVAALFGSCIPLVLNKFKLDPATGSGPIVTMVTDIFSFFSFLGIASLALSYYGNP